MRATPTGRQPGQRRELLASVLSHEAGVPRQGPEIHGKEIKPIKNKHSMSDAHLDGLKDHGILELKLHPESYEWRFVRTDESVGDASTEAEDCH